MRGGSQCASGMTVWNSTGNQRFGVVMKIPLCATRHASARNFVLPFAAADMFEDGAGMHESKFAIGEGEIASIGGHT